MSAGNVHRKASLILASAFSVMSIYDPRYFECAIGAITGIVIMPDLDVDAGSIANTMIKKRFGNVGNWVWNFFWHPYKLSFKHGQFASHFPIFGTFVRIFYILFAIILPIEAIIWLMLWFTNYNINLIYELKWWSILLLRPMFFYGLASADLIHYVLDKMTKESAK